eukprot:Platyproteum_vivax@DN7261_c0_g2_i4.p1
MRQVIRRMLRQCGPFLWLTTPTSKKGSTVTIKESPHAAANAISWSKCNDDKPATPGFTLCTPLNSGDGAKFVVDEILKDVSFTIQVNLKNSPKSLTPKFEVEVLDDGSNKEGATNAPHITSATRILDNINGSAVTQNNAVSEEAMYTFTFTKSGANITAGQTLEITAADYDFSACAGGRLSGPVSKCSGTAGKVVLTLAAIKVAQFSLTVGVKNSSSVGTPQFELLLKSGSTVTHKGKATGVLLVQTPYQYGEAFYDSDEDTTSQK